MNGKSFEASFQKASHNRLFLYPPSKRTKEMRVLVSKRSSTKAERIFAEILKKNHIPFKHREVIGRREVDFIIGNIAVEIDGHEQSPERNDWLVRKGYIPLHFNNKALIENRSAVEDAIINSYGLFTNRNSST